LENVIEIVVTFSNLENKILDDVIGIANKKAIKEVLLIKR